MQKIVLFLGCIAVLTTVSQAQTPQKLYPKISDITVYNNSAQIEKHVIVPLKKGLNEFIIAGNSSRIDASSIQFNKSKSYEITDFSPYIQVVEKDQAKIDRLSATEKQTVKVLKDSIEILQDRDTELRNSLNILNKEKSVLDGMKMISSPQNVDSIGKIKDGLAYYQTKMSEVNTSILKTKKSLEQNQKQLREKRNQLEVILQNDNAEINSNGKEYYIKLNVYAKQPVSSAVITYNYMISGVQWQTLYDINLSSNGDVAEFELKTQISQYSGEDWTDVNLTFSTDSPERDITDFTSEIQSEYANYYGEVIKTSKKQKTQQGKGTLLGRVVDAQTDEPLPFVNVVFKRNNVTLGGEATDIDGYFTAKDISAGDVTIEASYMGYDKVQKNISVSPNIFTNCGAIAMKPHVQALNEVMLVERSVPLLEDGHYEAGKKITSDDIDRIDGDNDLGNFVNGTSRKGSVYIPKTPMQPTTTEMPVDITKIESLGKEYKTDMSYTVKSDDKAKIIPLESATSRVKYKYLAIPKSNDRVFLCAYIPSWEKLGLMNSQANIYMDDKYIGRTEINTDNVKDTLTLKVNSEKRIAVERKQEVSAPEKAGSFSSQVVEKYTVTIAVKNNMLKDIDVDLKDLVPVSKYTEVTVTPVSLNGGKHNENTGEISWDLHLKSLESKSVEFSYTIRHPKK